MTEFLHLAGTLMDYFLEGIAPIRYVYIEQKIEKKKQIQIIPTLMNHFLQRNFPLRSQPKCKT